MRSIISSRPVDAATPVGSGPSRRLEIPILAAIPGLRHLFTVKGSDVATALAESVGRTIPLVTLRQVHGAVVRVVDGRDPDPAPEESRGSDRREAGDALVVGRPGIAAGVFVADCVPILICDEERRAAAAVHAGWRGTVAGVIGAAIAILRDRFGSEPASLRIAFGPCIGPCCFEVGGEVVDALLRAFPDASDCVVAGSARRIDLVEANRMQARAAGVPEDRMQAAGLCTMCRPDLLESYRRAGGTAGRMAGIIAWGGPAADAR
ncbi:MAG TPA: polyphenol oxidase family protein [Candidatus Dormibacteraeota bacterium]|nr:polyphenol oxidase family protein [Candidatus Dormibacteraeota bacterium]